MHISKNRHNRPLYDGDAALERQIPSEQVQHRRSDETHVDFPGMYKSLRPVTFSNILPVATMSECARLRLTCCFYFVNCGGGHTLRRPLLLPGVDIRDLYMSPFIIIFLVY